MAIHTDVVNFASRDNDYSGKVASQAGERGETVQKSRTKMKSKKVMTPVLALFYSSKTVVSKI